MVQQMIQWPKPDEIKAYRAETGEGLQTSRLILRRRAMLEALDSDANDDVFRDIIRAVIEDFYPEQRAPFQPAPKM
jgi:hypothetical protein